VQVRLFAILRERAGRDSVEVDVSEGATVAEAIGALVQLPGLGVLERLPVRVAVNREYANLETRLHAADELALIPPVSGGARPLIHARVTAEQLSLDALARAVSDTAAGAVVTFQGMPREIERLDYEAYAEMAQQQIAAILGECADRHGLIAAAAEHRVGSVPAMEASVIVAVSAPHRAQAFAGGREVIDRIKAEAPIWKVEVGADGSVTRV
jgi:MoaE-MoaD fusion protein